MTTIREHHSFGRRYLLVNVVATLPFVPVFALVWWRASSGIWDRWTWLGLGVFAVGGLFGLWFQHRRSGRFVCPECRRLIVGPIDEPEPGASIDFLCRHCDIRWKTGLRVSED